MKDKDLILMHVLNCVHFRELNNKEDEVKHKNAALFLCNKTAKSFSIIVEKHKSNKHIDANELIDLLHRFRENKQGYSESLLPLIKGINNF